jgi:hypothetical protein
MISTSLQGGADSCPTSFDAAPAADWSTDSLTADCDGSYTLCFTFKAGVASNPQPSDCAIVTVCTQAARATAATSVPFPDLPGWLANPGTDACVAQFQNGGGYGVMSVSGSSDACGPVQRNFQTVTYCPLTCGPNAPASCATCAAGGGGPF